MSADDFGEVGEAIDAQADDESDSSSITDEVEIRTPNSDSIEPNTYNIKPTLNDKFRVLVVKSLIRDILLEELGGKTYSAENAKEWTTNIANIINKRVRGMKWKRYKHAVQVLLGEQRGAGFRTGCKCIWDSETDNYASEFFTNDTIFCVVAVFAIYFY